ncbi:MAG: NAD-dependent epimerase/dehydratase family protein [Gammaproteobacteria bacterium]|nr:NAD-dependent epimerase/dehydratase family protein [Gammaproteobacteria bacterium]
MTSRLAGEKFLVTRSPHPDDDNDSSTSVRTFRIRENHVADNSKRRLLAALAVAFFSLHGPGGAATEVSSTISPSNTPRTVLVLGGTGQLGRAIVGELRKTPAKITIFSRSGSDRTGFEPPSAASPPIEWVTGDLLNAADVDRVFSTTTFDVVINAVRVEDGDIHFYEKIMASLTRNARRSARIFFARAEYLTSSFAMRDFIRRLTPPPVKPY